MKLDATIVVPAIVVFATLIVGWVLAWGDIRELRKENAKLKIDLRQERVLANRLVAELTDLKFLNPLTKEEASVMKQRKKRINGAPTGDERSPQSESSSWQVQSYYATHPSQTGKNQREASSGEAESKGWRERWS